MAGRVRVCPSLCVGVCPVFVCVRSTSVCVRVGLVFVCVGVCVCGTGVGAVLL